MEPETEDTVSPDHASAQFEPLQKASTLRHLLATIMGPVLWLVAIVVVGIVVEGRDSVEIGVTVTLISFSLSLVVSSIGHRRRLREEREAESP